MLLNTFLLLKCWSTGSVTIAPEVTLAVASGLFNNFRSLLNMSFPNHLCGLTASIVNMNKLIPDERAACQ